MKRVIATAFFFGVLFVVFYELIFFFLTFVHSLHGHSTAAGYPSLSDQSPEARQVRQQVAHNFVLEYWPAIRWPAALAGFLIALVVAIPFFFGGLKMVLLLLKRMAVTFLVFCLWGAILFVAISVMFILGLIIYVHATTPVQGNPEAAGWTIITAMEKAVGKEIFLVGGVAFLPASAGALVFAISSLSEGLKRALLLLRRLITAFICFGCLFLVLYESTLLLFAYLLIQAGMSNVQGFLKANGLTILVIIVATSLFLAIKFALWMCFTDRLPWCRAPAIPRKKLPGFMERPLRERPLPPRT